LCEEDLLACDPAGMPVAAVNGACWNGHHDTGGTCRRLIPEIEPAGTTVSHPLITIDWIEIPDR
jgi:hypothetical protein